jgi:hypothetical protein
MDFLMSESQLIKFFLVLLMFNHVMGSKYFVKEENNIFHNELP